MNHRGEPMDILETRSENVRTSNCPGGRKREVSNEYQWLSSLRNGRYIRGVTVVLDVVWLQFVGRWPAGW